MTAISTEAIAAGIDKDDVLAGPYITRSLDPVCNGVQWDEV